MVLIWCLSQHQNLTEEEEEKIERRATKFVAVTFFVLAGYVLFESVSKLLYQEISQPSLAGIIIAVISTIIMPSLALAKYRIGQQINSKALIADSKETIVCAFLLVALLLGLGLNYLFRFWQADPLVGFIIVFYLVKEGWEGWTESDEEDED